MDEIVKELAETDPIYDDPDYGPWCFFCAAKLRHRGMESYVDHTSTCLWLRATQCIEKK